jgi:hypothetical protein
MQINDVHKLEQSTIALFNFDGWDLQWCGDGFEHYDAKGKTPKGKKCVIEMKFRNKYYDTKILEKYKYDQLMALPDDIVKLYFVNDPKANYLYWLNDLSIPEVKEIECPSTTLWDQQKKNKELYFLSEAQAIIITKNQ